MCVSHTVFLCHNFYIHWMWVLGACYIFIIPLTNTPVVSAPLPPALFLATRNIYTDINHFLGQNNPMPLDEIQALGAAYEAMNKMVAGSPPITWLYLQFLEKPGSTALLLFCLLNSGSSFKSLFILHYLWKAFLTFLTTVNSTICASCLNVTYLSPSL